MAESPSTVEKKVQNRQDLFSVLLTSHTGKRGGCNNGGGGSCPDGVASGVFSNET